MIHPWYFGLVLYCFDGFGLLYLLSPLLTGYKTQPLLHAKTDKYIVPIAMLHYLSL